jgi:hypothetical protein
MMQITWRGRRVKTSRHHAPVAVPGSDWSAWLDGTEQTGMMIGHGPTEIEAVDHLLGQLFEEIAHSNMPPLVGEREILIPERA